MYLVPKFVLNIAKSFIFDENKKQSFKEKYITPRRNQKNIYNPFNYFDFPFKKRKFWKRLDLSSDICYKTFPKYKIIQKMNTMADGRYFLPHPVGVVIGADIKIGENVAIYQGTSIAYSFSGKPEIKDGATIFANCVVAGTSIIGKNSIIASGSVVIDKKIPANEIWGGVPSRFIRKLTKEEIARINKGL